MALMKLQIEGKEYAVDDLEVADLMPVEKELGVPFGQWDFDSLEVLAHLAHVLLGKENPEFTFEDATHLKMSVLLSPAEEESEEEDAGPPASSEAPSGSNGTASESTGTNDDGMVETNELDQPVVAGLP